MKQMARKYVYWPSLNNDIERIAKGCVTCKEYNPDRLPRVYIPWPKASYPMERVHVDFFEKTKKYLIFVDAYTKWVEVFVMKVTDAKHTIDALRGVFTRFGDPKLIVSDNGPPFNSQEFKSYFTSRSVTVANSPPRHPPSNGEAERWVGTVKSMLSKNDNVNLETLLFTLRTTPTTESNIIPAELMLSFQPRTPLEKLLPCKEPQMDSETMNIPQYRSFEIGEKAFWQGQNKKRLLVEIVQPIGNAMYKIKDRNGVLKLSHANQLCKYVEKSDVACKTPESLGNKDHSVTIPRRSARINKAN